MRDKIYTIPVTDAFKEDCECAICILKKKLEDEYVDYMLGPSLMEPDGRQLTNDQGFCRIHFELLYNKQVNRLGVGLILDTHFVEQTTILKKAYEEKKACLAKDAELSLIKNLSNKLSSKQTETEKFVDETLKKLTSLESKCTICNKLDFTMDRYIDVILYLWFEEDDFLKLFNSKPGFCMVHFRQLIEGCKKYLSIKEQAIFLDNLFKMQISNLERLQKEVNWFTKKFDYRYNDAPWENSKDSIQRGIQKLVGICELK